MPALVSLCMRIPRQTADWLHDVSKYFLLWGFYRKDIISTYSCRVGGGYFLQPLSRGWCKWESIVSGLVQNWIFKLIQLFFIFIFFSSSSSSHVPLRFVTSHPVRVTRIRQSSKKANFILERKKPLFKRVKLIWSINIEVNKQIKTGIFARYPGLLKAFYIDFLCFSQIVASFTLLLKEIL